MKNPFYYTRSNDIVKRTESRLPIQIDSSNVDKHHAIYP